VFYVAVGIAFFHSVAMLAPLFLVLALSLAVEMSLLGLQFGIRFPNFSESPRAAFVSQTGGLLAFPTAVIVGGLSLGPVLIPAFLRMAFQDLLLGFMASVLVIGVVSFVFYKLVFGQARRLLSQIPGG
jgi:hypothetical protein